MESFVEYCKNYIVEHIYDLQDKEVYACNLGYELTQGANMDGTLTYSRYDAKEYLREWWDECGEYWEWEKDNFGEHSHNPFEEPEAYMVCMVIEGVNAILSQCPVVEAEWDNEEVVWDEDKVERIRDYAKNFETDGSLF